MMEGLMQLRSRTTEWWTPLVFALAAVCQGVYLFGSHSRALAGFAFTLMFTGMVFTSADYLYKRGHGSARTLPGKFFSDGKDRSE
jgi:hypothetical protein